MDKRFAPTPSSEPWLVLLLQTMKVAMIRLLVARLGRRTWHALAAGSDTLPETGFHLGPDAHADSGPDPAAAFTKMEPSRSG